LGAAASILACIGGFSAHANADHTATRTVKATTLRVPLQHRHQQQGHAVAADSELSRAPRTPCIGAAAGEDHPADADDAHHKRSTISVDTGVRVKVRARLRLRAGLTWHTKGAHAP
jgi:hypothetical protein